LQGFRKKFRGGGNDFFEVIFKAIKFGIFVRYILWGWGKRGLIKCYCFIDL